MDFEFTTYYLTNNRCYIAGMADARNRMTPSGVLIHSTGANNNRLCRYIGPDDGVLGVNRYGNHWNRAEATACVHAMIGLDKNNILRCYMILPENIKCWGCGGGYNNTHLQVEIEEDALTNREYYTQAFTMAKKLAAYWCHKYGIEVTNKTLCSHKEGHDQGMASNHGDPHKWLNAMGDTMDGFREDVKKLLATYDDDETFENEVITNPDNTTKTMWVNLEDKTDKLNIRKYPNGTIVDALSDGTRVIVKYIDLNGWALLDNGNYAYAAFLSESCLESDKAENSSNSSTAVYTPTYYTVKKGDTLYRIAKNFSTTVEQLMRWNTTKIKDKNIINTGMVLQVGVDGDEPDLSDKEIQVTCSDSDTLWKLAKVYLGSGFKYTEIMKWNNLTSTSIRAGMVLTIKQFIRA